MTKKPIICVDFDGVIHSYENGWQDGEIYGHMIPGFYTWAVHAMESFQIHIYSSRSKDPEQIIKMKEWFVKELNIRYPEEKHDDFINGIVFSETKPPAFLTIDDRAVCFRGSWFVPELDVTNMKNFKPWNVK